MSLKHPFDFIDLISYQLCKVEFKCKYILQQIITYVAQMLCYWLFEHIPCYPTGLQKPEGVL